MTKDTVEGAAGFEQVETAEVKSAADDEIEVELFEDDPHWTLEWDAVLYEMRGFERQALGWTYTGNYRVGSLARALMGETPIPVEIRERLATMLHPAAEWRGPRLKVVAPGKKDIRDAQKKFAQKRKIQLDYEALTEKYGPGSSEAAGDLRRCRAGEPRFGPDRSLDCRLPRRRPQRRSSAHSGKEGTAALAW